MQEVAWVMQRTTAPHITLRQGPRSDTYVQSIHSSRDAQSGTPRCNQPQGDRGWGMVTAISTDRVMWGVLDHMWHPTQDTSAQDRRRGALLPHVLRWTSIDLIYCCYSCISPCVDLPDRNKRILLRSGGHWPLSLDCVSRRHPGTEVRWRSCCSQARVDDAL